MPYQSFDGVPGHSQSREKLERLRIKPATWDGAKVLDIGCNAGFFCEAAHAAGAAVVTGVDVDRELINAARERAPDGVSYTARNWDELPAGPWDVVLILSAIHYEQDQVGLLRRICDTLAPGGVLVLECGIAPIGGNRWQRCTRPGNSTVRFPSMECLVTMLNDAGLVSRYVGRSVDQKGDAIPRHVLHCQVKQPVLLLVSGPGLAGKTTLARDLGGLSFSVDDHVRTAITTERAPWTDYAREVGTDSLLPFYRAIAERGGELLAGLVDSIFDCLPTGTVVVDVIEELTLAIRAAGIDRGFKVWTASEGVR